MRVPLLVALLTVLGAAPVGAFHNDELPIVASAEGVAGGWVSWRIDGPDDLLLFEVDAELHGGDLAIALHVLADGAPPAGFVVLGIGDGAGGTRLASTALGGDLVRVDASEDGTYRLQLDIATREEPVGEREIVAYVAGDISAWRVTLRDPGATTLVVARSGNETVFADLSDADALAHASADAAGSRALVYADAAAGLDAEGRFFGGVLVWSGDRLCVAACPGLSMMSVSAQTPEGPLDCAREECWWMDAPAGAYAARATVVDPALGAFAIACAPQSPQCAELSTSGTRVAFFGADIRAPR